LGPEMKSTGEVMGIGKNFGEAFAKGQSAAGEILASSGQAFISVKDIDKELAIIVAQELTELGFEICATLGTSNILNKAGIKCNKVNKVREGEPHIVNMLENNEIGLIVNTTEGKNAIADSFSIRRTALQHKVFYTTTMAAAQATVEALKQKDYSDVNSLQKLHIGISS